MTADRTNSAPRPDGGVGSESRFLEKSERYFGAEKPARIRHDINSRPYQMEVRQELRTTGTVFGQRQGYFSRKIEKFREKVRANVSAAKRHTWSVVSANPFIDTKRPRYVYRVRNGELTVTNQKGEVITRQKDVRLEKYNGITLKGEQSDRKKLTVKGGIKDRIKLSFLEGSFAGIKDRHQKEMRYRRRTAIGFATGGGRSKKYKLELIAPEKPYESKWNKIKRIYRETKESIKYRSDVVKSRFKQGSDGVKSGFKKAKVFVNQYREGEGIFSYRSEDTRQQDIDGDVLEVGQIRGRR